MILVVGATGNLGGAVTRMLLEQGQSTRILARPQSNCQPLANLGAQVVLGDLKQLGTLSAACEGADIVISTASGGQRGGEDTVETVDWEGHRNLIDAAKTASVKQFIFVSVAFADPQSRGFRSDEPIAIVGGGSCQTCARMMCEIAGTAAFLPACCRKEKPCQQERIFSRPLINWRQPFANLFWAMPHPTKPAGRSKRT